MEKKYLIPRLYVEMGEYLQACRLATGLTQREVSVKLGYSSGQFISNFERGIAVPPIKKLNLMMKLYQISATELVTRILKGERQILSTALKGGG